MIDRTELAERLARLPRVPLAQLPTPLHDVPRLGKAIGLPNLRIKRDDLTGLALGGNKTRQLEWLFGDALAQGATAIVTGAGVQSNHLRHVAAACAKLGLEACLIMRGDPADRAEGNFLLDELLGAKYRFLGERFYDEFAASAQQWSDEIRAAGGVPYLIDTLGYDSASLGMAALGYVQAAFELDMQFDAEGWRPQYVWVCSGAATQAGLLVAKHALGLSYKIVGISASPFIPNKQEVIAKVANRAAKLLDIDVTIQPSDVTNLDEYIGPGYGIPTPESKEALLLTARTEGILLDPTYTSKAMAALIDHRRRDILPADANVLFIHTGGAPNLFLSRNANLADPS